MKIRNIFSLATMLLPMAMTAQTNITFEEQDYKALGVYDTWEESPFRTGKLNGNYAVIDNHLTYVDSYRCRSVQPVSHGKEVPGAD